MEKCSAVGESGLCETDGIPKRLHSEGRSAAPISNEDRVFMRHPTMPPDSSYMAEIPGHVHLCNQSVNSEKRNVEGEPEDVLYNVADGQVYPDQEVACLNVDEILNISYPHAILVKRDRNGKPIEPTDPQDFRFIVRHTPAPCMFPHCEIFAYRDEGHKGMTAVKKINSSEQKSAIKRLFARIANKNRKLMTDRRRLREST